MITPNKENDEEESLGWDFLSIFIVKNKKWTKGASLAGQAAFSTSHVYQHFCGSG